MIKRFLIISFIAGSIVSLGFAHEKLPKRLNWISSDQADNLCQGYYIDKPIQFSPAKQLKHPEKSYNITADDVEYALKGPSKLKGNVILTRPDKRVHADKVKLFRRDSKPHSIKLIQAQGHLRLFSPGELMVAKQGILNLDNETFTLNNVDFRISSQPDLKPSTIMHHGHEVHKRAERHYRGHAQSIKKVKDKQYDLNQTSLTTCPPSDDGSCVWHLKSTRIHLDTHSGVGQAYNTSLWFLGAPIFYTPYANFPLNDKRKSGFLYPSLGQKSDSGVHLTVPYYINWAPNYDLTLTPQIYTRRGFMLGSEFRYLTSRGHGQLQASVLPADAHFKDFQHQAEQEHRFQSRDDSLKRLQDASDWRYALHYQDGFRWSDHWLSDIHYSRVSDDYYIQDFGDSLINNSDANLLQKAQLDYQGVNWHATGLLQHYQTLHPVNRATNDNQYARLPELKGSGDYMGIYPGLDPSITLQSVYFHKTLRPDSPKDQAVNGERLSIQPSVQYMLARPYGYIKPEIKAQLTQYWLDHDHSSLHQKASNAVPTFDVHGKLNIERFFDARHNHYKQTLEPEFLYVLTPHESQNNIPIFDTSTRSFDYNYMFDTNRFSGADRVGDTNRMTLALTSRFINAHTGSQIGSVSIGDIVYFTNREVTHCEGNNCSPDAFADRHISPLVGKGDYQITRHWQGDAQLVWNPHESHFSRQQASLAYQQDQTYLLNLDYQLIKGDDFVGHDSDNRLKQAKVGGAWQINPRWRVLGHFGYTWQGNNNKNHGNTYLAGVEYDSCCWGLRFVGARTFEGVDDQNRNEYDNTVSLQIIFKGFGSVGNKDAKSLLSDTVSNYKTPFNTAGIL